MSGRRRQEQGIALPAAIALAVVAVVLLSAVSAYVMSRVADTENRRDRVVSVPVVDTAMTRLRIGLERDLLPEHNDFVPTKAGLQQLVAGTDATVLDGSFVEPAIPSPMPDVTIREPVNSEVVGYWQLLQVFPPEYAEADDEGMVVVYIRAWQSSPGAGAVGTEPRIYRTEFRPGRFADFQAVIDGPIVFGPGAEINGPIHTNGFADDRANFLDTVAPTTKQRIWTADASKVTCTGAAQITTAEGDVEPGAFPGCPVKTGTKRYVNLLAAEESFERINGACTPGGNIRCFNETYEGSSVPGTVAQKPPDLRGYRVELKAEEIVVSGYEVNWTTEQLTPYPVAGAGTIPTPKGSTTVLRFADNVVLSGTTKARVTIAARKQVGGGGGVKSGAANIYLIGNTAHEGDGSVLGLLAQGSIIVGAIKKPDGSTACLSTLRAGMVAMSGTLTIDPRYTTRLYQDGAPQCGKIDLYGALAAHRSPVLFWEWDNVAGHAGYATRDYAWNDSMRRNPPPYFPITDTWQPRHLRPANLDCFGAGGISDPDC